MTFINKVILQGTVGRTPETRYISNGVSATSFSLATTETETIPDGRQVQITEWHTVEACGNLSDYASQYIKKGDLLYVEGKLKSRYISERGIAGHRIYLVMASSIDIKARSNDQRNTPLPDPTDTTTTKVGGGIPGFDIENIPINLKAGNELPF